MSTAIILTGLPASGKSTLGRALAQELGWPCLDKDDFLEVLYAHHAVAGMEDRRRLSREADHLFQQAASGLSHCVLISHWRPRGLGLQTGTPADWLAQGFERVIEVYCPCGAAEAARRFSERQRHPKHMDHLRSPRQVLGQMMALEPGYPLQAGELIEAPQNEDGAASAVQLAARIAGQENPA